jgi:hypothetical protein
MKLILAVRNEFEAYLIISAVYSKRRANQTLTLLKVSCALAFLVLMTMT